MKKPWGDYSGTPALTGKWFYKNDNFTSKLYGQQKRIIEAGDTNNWDTTILIHALLYSSHFLLLSNPLSLEKFKHHCITSSNANQVRRYNQLLLHSNSDMQVVQVNTVSNNQIKINQEIKLEGTFKFYVCSDEWCSIQKLAQLRNKYGHYKEGKIEEVEWLQVKQEVNTIYTKLNLADHIKSLQVIFEERVIEPRILQEHKQIWENMHDGLDALNSTFVEIQSTVVELQSTISTEHTGIQEVVSEIKPAVVEMQSTLSTGLSEIQEGVSEINPSIIEMQSTLSTQLSEIQEEMHQINSKLPEDRLQQVNGNQSVSPQQVNGNQSVSPQVPVPTELTAGNAFQLLKSCGFMIFTNWSRLGSVLRVPIDERNELKTRATIYNNFDDCLEECLSKWISKGEATWEKLFEAVGTLEKNTARLMRECIQ